MESLKMIAELNTEQVTATESTANRLLVLAGPGTGKTSTLVGRYLHLVKNGADPRKILCCVFGKGAAKEIEERLKEDKIKNTEIRTFHALGLKIMHEYGQRPDILSDDKKRTQIIRTLRLTFNIFY